MTTTILPNGTSLYLRAVSQKRHGTPAAFASRAADHGLQWLAIAGPWHDERGPRLINSPATCRRYADALAKKGVQPWIWGYPWQGHEERFAREMRECAGDHKRGLLDPELGSNPTRAKQGRGKERANEHAAQLVALMAEQGFDACGLSTFGSGWRMGWFPLLAFTRALLEHFRGRTFIGGQTYTDDSRIDMSIADMIACIRKADPRAAIALLDDGCPDIEVVPNFGTYKFVPKDPTQRLSTKNRKAVPKTPAEMRLHLYEFINENEPVDAMIGWAENFMNAQLWEVLAEFAALLKRGAGRLRQL